jgi:diguanylate cyclase (GGDEF)-like protein/PAS domain S-box-containing protein
LHHLSKGRILPDRPTYEVLKKKAAGFDRLKAAYRRIKGEVRDLKETAEKNALQLESVIEHCNLMAMEGHVSFLELKQVFNASSDSLWVVDKEFKIRLINKTLLNMFGKREAGIIGKRCYDFLSVSACHSLSCPLKRILKGKKHVEFDIDYIKEDQTVVPCILSASPFFGLDGDIIGIVVSFKDITERRQVEDKLKELNQELERLATVDSLTQIPNRREFDRCLKREWFRLRRNQRPLSLIMCDVDYFKQFNDTYGHAAGDECLYSVAQSIRSSLKRAADFAARYGGEEFAVILPEVDAQGAFHVAETIRKHVRRLGIAHQGSSVAPTVTLSLGVSTLIPEESMTPEMVVESADKALYQAKQAGRNQTASQMLALQGCE